MPQALEEAGFADMATTDVSARKRAKVRISIDNKQFIVLVHDNDTIAQVIDVALSLYYEMYPQAKRYVTQDLQARTRSSQVRLDPQSILGEQRFLELWTGNIAINKKTKRRRDGDGLDTADVNMSSATATATFLSRAFAPHSSLSKTSGVQTRGDVSMSPRRAAVTRSTTRRPIRPILSSPSAKNRQRGTSVSLQAAPAPALAVTVPLFGLSQLDLLTALGCPPLPQGQPASIATHDNDDTTPEWARMWEDMSIVAIDKGIDTGSHVVFEQPLPFALHHAPLAPVAHPRLDATRYHTLSRTRDDDGLPCVSQLYLGNITSVADLQRALAVWESIFPRLVFAVDSTSSTQRSDNALPDIVGISMTSEMRAQYGKPRPLSMRVATTASTPAATPAAATHKSSDSPRAIKKRKIATEKQKEPSVAINVHEMKKEAHKRKKAKKLAKKAAKKAAAVQAKQCRGAECRAQAKSKCGQRACRQCCVQLQLAGGDVTCAVHILKAGDGKVNMKTSVPSTTVSVA
eukprot:TRINITY_DN29289_c0_g1_i1.p1 TRINITY_DN29289_c0_g1~~TRINITY_DN29289_c0_g1_i1.p1  ORF type:complete len:517 (+),score=66.11 TRINITY_DN29289_c0_g1_i1:200-1750(+)